MFVTLMTREGCHTVSLPETKNGKYWLRSVYAMHEQNLLSIEAIDGEWCVIPGEAGAAVNEHNRMIAHCVLKDYRIYKVWLSHLREEAYLVTEPNSAESISYSKLVVRGEQASLKIGKGSDCEIQYDNPMVSSSHAVLYYRDGVFSISDTGSTNGTFVNNCRVQEQTLRLGDVVYIIGLKIIIGNGLFAINSPNGRVTIQCGQLDLYEPESKMPESDYPAEPTCFTRSPQFKSQLEPCELSVELPPSKQNPEEMPMMLALGSSMTMGMASMTTALFSVNHAMQNGNISAAVPSIAMSVSMLAGSVLWPILTRRYNRRKKEENEQKRLKLYRSYIDDLAAQLDHALFQQAQILNTNYISLRECINRILNYDRQLWERAINDNEFLALRLGTGKCPMIGEIKLPPEKISLIDDPLIDEMKRLLAKPRELTEIPIVVSLFRHKVIGITGDIAGQTSMIRNLIMQMVTLYGYDYLKLGFFLCKDDRKRFEFARILPHVWDDQHKVRFISENDNEIKELSIYFEHEFDANEQSGNKDTVRPPYYVLITLEPQLCLSVGILKKILEKEGNCGFSLIVAANELRDLPKECERVISVQENEAYLLERENLQAMKSSFLIEQDNRFDFCDVSRVLANINLKTGGVSASIPTKVEFLEMYQVSKAEHLNVIERWKNNDPTLTLEAPIGRNAYGNLFMLDLHQNIHGPHGLVAGMTGSGKSEFIITYILSMAVNYHPHEVAFVLIDYKGGGMAKTFEKLPHTVGIITNLDGSGVKRSLVSIKSEIDRRQALFLKIGEKIGESNIDIYKYQKLYRNGIAEHPMPHLFIISDEFAELKQQRPEFMDQLISIARIGRSLGVHLILATQKPAGVVNEQIWSNSKFKVCLKVQTKEDSHSMLNRADAASLVQTGRFYLQIGYNELFEIGQSAWAGAPYTEGRDSAAQKTQLISAIDNIGRVISARELKDESAAQKEKPMKQVDVITEYLYEIAKAEGIVSNKLWCDPIDECIFSAELEQKYGYTAQPYDLNPLLGEIDDPQNQRQILYTIPISRLGNAIVMGNVGSGKAMYLNMLLYSLLSHHSPKELHIYIMDFDAETMTVFADAPQVGGVVLIDETEKLDKLLQMLSTELNERKKRYIDYGGDYESYNRKAEQKDPAILLAINNLTAFEETYEIKLNALIRIARNGTKYGIFTVATRIGAFGIRYKLLSCFSQRFVLQCGDETEYANVLGKTDGMVPAAFEGRGLLRGESSVLEFQTARFTAGDPMDELMALCSSLRQKYQGIKARAIPVLPNTLTSEALTASADIQPDDLVIPIGLFEKNVQPCLYDFSGQFLNLVLSGGIQPFFVQHLLNVLSKQKQCQVMLLDAGYQFNGYKDTVSYAASDTDVNSKIVELFQITVQRNNEYKTVIENGGQPPVYDRLVVVIGSLADLFAKLTDDGADKLKNLLLYGQKEYQMNFIIMERAASLSEFYAEEWYKKHVTERDAVWIGGNLNRQLRLQCNNPVKDTIGDDYAYVLKNGTAELIKIPSAPQEGQ